MIWLWIILGVVAAAVLGYIVWISIQSLIQANLLRQASNQASSGGGTDRPVAIHGRLRVLAAVNKGGRRNMLWCHTVYQERRGWGRNRRWSTVGEEVDTAQFVLDCNGREIHVNGHPTEVQGAHRDREYGGGGFFGFFTGAHSRVIYRWLPVVPSLTVVGRLESAGKDQVLMKGPKVGLLFSPHEPGRAATQETAKGVGGLILVVAGLAAGIWFIVTNF